MYPPPKNPPVREKFPVPENTPTNVKAFPVRTRGKIFKLPTLLSISEEEEYLGDSEYEEENVAPQALPFFMKDDEDMEADF